MTTWRRFSEEAPALAAVVRAEFEATKHHVLATLRADGSPRVSGTEVEFNADDLTFGSMLDAVKARDLRRDGRCALHANPGESMGRGDAKVSGTAVEVDVDEPYHLFRIELSEVVLTSVDEERGLLVIESWRAGRGVERRTRK